MAWPPADVEVMARVEVDPCGMTAGKARAKAKTKLQVSPLRQTIRPFGSGRDDRSCAGYSNDSIVGGYSDDRSFAGYSNDRIVGGYSDDRSCAGY